jgi:hypothetical protein
MIIFLVPSSPLLNVIFPTKPLSPVTARPLLAVIWPSKVELALNSVKVLKVTTSPFNSHGVSV